MGFNQGAFTNNNTNNNSNDNNQLSSESPNQISAYDNFDAFPMGQMDANLSNQIQAPFNYYRI